MCTEKNKRYSDADSRNCLNPTGDHSIYAARIGQKIRKGNLLQYLVPRIIYCVRNIILKKPLTIITVTFRHSA